MTALRVDRHGIPGLQLSSDQARFAVPLHADAGVAVGAPLAGSVHAPSGEALTMAADAALSLEAQSTAALTNAALFFDAAGAVVNSSALRFAGNVVRFSLFFCLFFCFPPPYSSCVVDGDARHDEHHCRPS